MKMKILNDLSTILVFSLLIILGVRNLKNEFDIFSFISLVILVLFLLSVHFAYFLIQILLCNTFSSLLL